MTDNELRALVASIAEGHKKTDIQLAQTDAQLAQAIARSDARDNAFDKRMNKLSAKIDSIAEGQNRTDEQLAITCAKVDKMAEMYGGMSNNQGAATEQFYYNSLQASPILQGIHFNKVHKNLHRVHQGVEDEYDILMVNTNAVFIIEVKYKVHPKDLKRLAHKKAFNFNCLFKEYADFTKHLGIACFHIDDALIQQAVGMGINVLQRRGQIFEIDAAKAV